MLMTFLFMLALWQIYTNRHPALAYIMGTSGEAFGEDNREEIRKITEDIDHTLQMMPESLGNKAGPGLSVFIFWVIGLMTSFYFALSLTIIESLPYRFITTLLMLLELYTQVITAKFFVEYFRRKGDWDRAGTPWGPLLCLILTIHAVVTIILLFVI